MFYLKKSLMGYKAVENEEEADYMAWSVTDGNKLLEDLRENKENFKDYQTKYIDLLGVRNDLNLKVNNLTKDITDKTQELKELKELYSKVLDELNAEQKKNANFLRISKERANADRGLTPKKKHHGYIELYREQTELTRAVKQKISSGFNSRVVAIKIGFSVWRYNFQTPYLTSLPAHMVKDLVLKDFSNMGIAYDREFNLYNTQSDIERALNSNSIFNFSLYTKNNSKYWELKFQAGQNFTI